MCLTVTFNFLVITFKSQVIALECKVIIKNLKVLKNLEETVKHNSIEPSRLPRSNFTLTSSEDQKKKVFTLPTPNFTPNVGLTPT